MDDKGGRGDNRGGGGGGRYRDLCVEDHFDESHLGVMTTAAVATAAAAAAVVVIAMETAIAAAKFSFLVSTGNYRTLSFSFIHCTRTLADTQWAASPNSWE